MLYLNVRYTSSVGGMQCSKRMMNRMDQILTVPNLVMHVGTNPGRPANSGEPCWDSDASSKQPCRGKEQHSF